MGSQRDRLHSIQRPHAQPTRRDEGDVSTVRRQRQHLTTKKRKLFITAKERCLEAGDEFGFRSDGPHANPPRPGGDANGGDRCCRNRGHGITRERTCRLSAHAGGCLPRFAQDKQRGRDVANAAAAIFLE